jgi:hypothetical protein
LDAILLAQHHQGAVGPRPRGATRLGEQQQREQAGHLGLVRHERGKNPRQPDRLAAQPRFGWAGQPGVVDQVDDGQHGAEAVGQLGRLRHAVGDLGGLDLVLGADETTRHRWLCHQERSCDLLGRQAAKQPQSERHLRLRGQSRVAAGEDEPQPVVVHGSHLLEHARLAVAGSEHRHLAEQLPAPCLAAQPVDGMVAGGRGDPAARIGRHAIARPLSQGDGEGLLDRVLGDVDVAEGTDQGGQRPARLLAEDPADLDSVEPFCGVAVTHAVRPRIPRTDGPRSAP